jgi:hypothetical protein
MATFLPQSRATMEPEISRSRNLAGGGVVLPPPTPALFRDRSRMTRMTFPRHLTLAACGLALVPAAAMASQQGLQVMKKWQQADKCAAQAHTAFPDYNPQSNAKRDAALEECLDRQDLPPREDLARPR